MIGGSVAYVQGKSHVRAGKCNQDAYCIMPLEDMWIAVVADGVGSCKCAELASSMAVETVCRFIYENFPIDYSPVSIKSMLRTAFNRALKEIYREAEKNHDPISEYQTTLMVVLYDSRRHQRSYCAHVGDGSIYGLKKDGTFTILTTRQQTADGCVIPLSAGYEFWEISELTEEYASLVMATDGLSDKIRNSFIDGGVYVPLMLLFDPYVVRYLEHANVNYSKLFADPDSVPRRIVYEAIYRALRKEYGFKRGTALNILHSIKEGALFKVLESIQDDITAVCCYNTDIIPESREAKYYMEPDWKSIYDRTREMLYPTLVAEKGGKESLSAVTTKDALEDDFDGNKGRLKLILEKLLREIVKNE